MKHVQVSRGYAALVDDEDYERVARYKWHAQVRRRKDGSIRNVYAMRHLPSISGRRTSQPLHRFILGVSDPDIQVDHKDHDGLNCRRLNLRIATGSQNQANSRLSVRNTSGFRGVSWDKWRGAWRALARINGRKITLGRFVEIKDAARAYDAAVKSHFGEFAALNFPE